MTHEEANIAHEASAITRQQCVEFLEAFAQDYVNKWTKTTGDSAKAEGWAILQASVALRDATF